MDNKESQMPQPTDLDPFLEESWWVNECPLLYEKVHLPNECGEFYDTLFHALRTRGEEMVRNGELHAEKYQYFLQNGIDEERFPIEQFPLIEDFEVHLRDVKPDWEGNLTCHIYFSSPTRGKLFGVWEGHQVVMPWGDFFTPYYTFDQSLEDLLAEKDGFVYILSGSTPSVGLDEGEKSEGYHTWFRVETTRYKREWMKVLQHWIELCKSHQSDPSRWRDTQACLDRLQQALDA